MSAQLTPGFDKINKELEALVASCNEFMIKYSGVGQTKLPDEAEEWLGNTYNNRLRVDFLKKVSSLEKLEGLQLQRDVYASTSEYLTTLGMSEELLRLTGLYHKIMSNAIELYNRDNMPYLMLIISNSRIAFERIKMANEVLFRASPVALEMTRIRTSVR